MNCLYGFVNKTLIILPSDDDEKRATHFENAWHVINGKLTGGTLELPIFEINLNYLFWKKTNENRKRNRGAHEHKNTEMDNPGDSPGVNRPGIFNFGRTQR